MGKRQPRFEAGFLFREFFDTRSRHKDVRAAGAPFAERAEQLDRADNLHYHAALLRRFL